MTKNAHLIIIYSSSSSPSRQEVDDFSLWWVPRLNAAGYDSVYHERTGHYDDGLVIAFRRMIFQVFRTHRMNLNDMIHECGFGNSGGATNENLIAKLEQDNVALVVALQPWEDSTFPSAICVGIV